MTIQRTQVRYDPDDRRLKTSVRQINTELDGLKRKANDSIRATRQARAEAAGLPGGRFGSGFRAGRNKMQFGPVDLNSRGFMLNAGMMRGAFGRSVGVGLAAHAVGGSLNTLADLRDRVNEMQSQGAQGGEIARAVGGDVARSVVDTVGAVTGISSVVRGIARFLPPAQVEDAKQRFDDVFRTREELERRRESMRRAREQREAEINTRYQEALGRINATLPQTFRLKTGSDVALYHRLMLSAKTPTGFSNAEIADVERKAAREKAKGDTP